MSQLPLKQVIELIVLSLLVAPKPTKPWDNAAPIVTTGFLWLLESDELRILHLESMILVLPSKFSLAVRYFC
jgi:hypothetical protein